MNSKNLNFIENELKQFKRKFWLTKLLQGILIFVGTGVVFFGLLSLIEFFSWLSVTQRTWLFAVTAVVEIVLLATYIIWPSLQLVIVGNALSDTKAAKLIGNALPGVRDRLTNYLELKQQKESSDLIDASLNQKQALLREFKFSKAVTYRTLKPFLLFLIPFGLLLAFFTLGNNWFMFTEGAGRLVNFSTEYKRKLPFSIELLSDSRVAQGNNYTLKISTTGKIIPEQLVLVTSTETRVLNRQNGSEFSSVFRNVLNDFSIHFVYNSIESDPFFIQVEKQIVLGKTALHVIPPAYTKIESFDVVNSREVLVPMGSQIGAVFQFKNTDWLTILRSNFSDLDTVLYRLGDTVLFTVNEQTKLQSFANNEQLNSVDIDVILDKRPLIDVQIDSTEIGLKLVINIHDDYEIRSAKILFETEGEEAEIIQLPKQGALVKSAINLTYAQIEEIEIAKIYASDQLGTSLKEIDLQPFKNKPKSVSQLLGEAGSNLDELKAEENDNDETSTKAEKSKKRTEKAKELKKKADAMTKKDSVLFERFKELSEEIEMLAEKLEESLPEKQEEISEKKLEEKIAELEKEWQILQAIEKLKGVEDSLAKKNNALDEEQMQEVQKSAEDLQKTLDAEEKEKVSWEKFDELQRDNEQLKKEQQKADETSSEDTKSNENNQDTSGDKQESSEQKSGSKSPKKNMQENSKELRNQLEQLSDVMAFETAQKNVELVRRLELRALKNSKKQEEIYELALSQDEIERYVFITQKEVSESAQNILDSLHALTVSDPKLSQVLAGNEEKLAVNVAQMENTDVADSKSFLSNQRYLQYGLNDLAAILYEILKSESQSMMQAKAGNKQCNNPKPGKGKKPSLSKQQSELGKQMSEMGKTPKTGKGNKGKKTMGGQKMLEILKGQEQILDQLSEEKNEGKNAGIKKEIAEEMNKQLDDLLNNNIDKALERNKSIEDKLITLEMSENTKKEQEEKRQSKENVLDYESIKNTVITDFLKSPQTGSGVVTLPTLKNYFTGKWIQINQE